MNLLSRYVLPYLKAHAAAFGAFATAVVADCNGIVSLSSLEALTLNQWLGAAGAAGLFGGAVFAIGNKPQSVPAAAMFAEDPDPAPASVAPEDAVPAADAA